MMQTKLFSFKNTIKISSECKRNLISSLNTTACNPALGLHMEDFWEQITTIYLKNKLIEEDFFQQKKQTLPDL